MMGIRIIRVYGRNEFTRLDIINSWPTNEAWNWKLIYQNGIKSLLEGKLM